EARPAVGPLTAFDPEGLQSRVAGEVRGFDPRLYLKSEDEKRVPRVMPMALAAAREALEDAGVDVRELPLEESRKIGVLLGTGAGGVDFAENQYAHFFKKELRKATPYAISSSFVGMLSSELSIYLGLRGPSHVISTGCTSSTDAIGYAMRSIRHGEAEAVLTGGAEACITPAIMAGFDRMKVTSSAFNDSPGRASRPFNGDRDGFVLGEGAWVFLLESYERAKARRRKIYGTVAGYGSTCDAFHRVMVEPSGVEAARALGEAMADAGVGRERVGYVNLHGTSTRMNDLIETMAVKAAFNGHSGGLSTSGTKSMIGHPQGACGAAGVAAALYALGSGEIPPTINYESPDAACDLDYTPNRPVRRQVEYALCNCLAFGSKNSALLLGRADSIGQGFLD
ncbi:MAG TPA: beta-ketoacyl-[acyl-carrier-protein] synthase family protein, partial [Candidatus Eisenbacteria bacterium]|nr:beta-ketoacyl-[acyl-carrier-protein] synthase family protein [Candidatus Eisenbacteria bacterium]